MFKRVNLNQWRTKDCQWVECHYNSITAILLLFKESYKIAKYKKSYYLTFPKLIKFSQIPEYQTIIDTIHNLYAGGDK